MNTYSVRVWYQGADQSEDFTVIAQTTSQAEHQVQQLVDQDRVVLFDVSRLQTA
jgi:hypothetical protein